MNTCRKKRSKGHFTIKEGISFFYSHELKKLTILQLRSIKMDARDYFTKVYNWIMKNLGLVTKQKRRGEGREFQFPKNSMGQP